MTVPAAAEVLACGPAIAQFANPSRHNSTNQMQRSTVGCHGETESHKLQGYRRNSYLSANAGMLMTMNLKLLLGSSARTETRSRRLATVTLLSSLLKGD